MIKALKIKASDKKTELRQKYAQADICVAKLSRVKTIPGLNCEKLSCVQSLGKTIPRQKCEKLKSHSKTMSSKSW